MALDNTAPKPIIATARPRLDTNQVFTKRIEFMPKEPWPRARRLAKAT